MVYELFCYYYSKIYYYYTIIIKDFFFFYKDMNKVGMAINSFSFYTTYYETILTSAVKNKYSKH